MPEFNPASDLPTTREQLDQVQAVAVAEFEWDTVGGKMIDAILDRETSAIDAADKLTDRYGVTRTFWHRHLTGVLEDRGEMLTGCPVCGETLLKIEAVTPVSATVQFSGDDQTVLEKETGKVTWTDESATVCTSCGFSGQLADFRILAPVSPE